MSGFTQAYRSRRITHEELLAQLRPNDAIALGSWLGQPHGLMRANWPSDELLSNDRRGFELTAEQRAATEHLPIGRVDEG